MKLRIFASFIIVLMLRSMFALPPSLEAQSNDDPEFHVRIQTVTPRATRAWLERAGYDVLETSAKSSTLEVVTSRAGVEALQETGLAIAAVTQAHSLKGTLRGGPFAVPPLLALKPQPTNYRDLDAVLNRLHDLAAMYPGIARVVDITAEYGTPPTFEGRHLFALKISDNVLFDEDEPAVLIVSNHHAREIVTPVIALEAAERLTSGYHTDPELRSAIEEHEIWIAPTWNPDGYNYVFTGNNLWRKNRRILATAVGVDQNRNYAQGWTATCAGSTSPSSETYKGPSAASEAETQTMMTWSQAERFAKVIDYHSSGREVLYSYLCLSHPFTNWLRQEAIALSQASGYGGTVRLPSAEGEHPQWQFAKLGSYAFLIETHTEFQPSYQSALNEAAMVWPGILTVLRRPISIRGHVTNASTGAPLAATIELLNVTFANGETNSSGGAYGAYHMFLPPGTYDVRFSKAGYVPAVRQVTVTNASSTAVDVQLAPETVPFWQPSSQMGRRRR